MLLMLAGPPGSGKSTYAKRLRDNPSFANDVLLSTDAHIESIAASTGRSYNELFPSAIKDATHFLNASLQCAIGSGRGLIWDQTNLEPGTRVKKLARVPHRYVKIAVYFEEDLDTLLLRNKERAEHGRGLPEHVLISMISRWKRPSLDEGFTAISRGPRVDD
jgi:predicted kinase